MNTAFCNKMKREGGDWIVTGLSRKTGFLGVLELGNEAYIIS